MKIEEILNLNPEKVEIMNSELVQDGAIYTLRVDGVKTYQVSAYADHLVNTVTDALDLHFGPQYGYAIARIYTHTQPRGDGAQEKER